MIGLFYVVKYKGSHYLTISIAKLSVFVNQSDKDVPLYFVLVTPNSV